MIPKFHQRIEGQYVRVGQFLEAEGLTVAFECHVRPEAGAESSQGYWYFSRVAICRAEQYERSMLTGGGMTSPDMHTIVE
jgi:hypothetical protein